METQTTCSYIFKRGSNKGNVCGAIVKCVETLSSPASCSLHQKKLPENNGLNSTTTNHVTCLLNLPNDVLCIVLENIASHVTRASINKPQLAIKTLARLSSTCKDLNCMIDRDPDDAVWQSAWNTFQTASTTTIIPPSTSKMCAKKLLMLHSMTGCEFCKAPRIRKIYTEFGVRCCKTCLFERTLSDYRLKTDYFVNVQSRLQHLPYTTCELWSRYAGSYTLRFYWKTQVEDKLGVSLDIFAKEETDRRQKAAFEAQRIAQEAAIEVQRIAKESYKQGKIKLLSDISDALNSHQSKHPFNIDFICNDKHCASAMDKAVKSSVYMSFPCQTVNEILTLAMNAWTQKLELARIDANRIILDTFIKIYTRQSRKESENQGAGKIKLYIKDIRYTNIYNTRVAAGATEFTKDDWDMVCLELFDWEIENRLGRDPVVKNISNVNTHPIYLELRTQRRVPTDAEWTTISYPFVEEVKAVEAMNAMNAMKTKEANELKAVKASLAKQQNIARLRQLEKIQAFLKPSDWGNKQDTCKFCQHNPKKYNFQGIGAHIQAVHVNRNFWPVGNALLLED